MRSGIPWTVLAMAATLAGCGAVYSTQPVGEASVAVRAADWDGTWLQGEGTLTLKVEDEGSGRIRGVWVEWGHQGPRLESHVIELRRSGDAMFANVGESDANGRMRYAWARMRREGNVLIAWIPDVERFKAACRVHRLPCREQEEHVVLIDPSAEHMMVLASLEAALLYRWDQPVVLIRLASKEE